MSHKSTTSSPLAYIKHRRALRAASKPTAVSLITTRPYINPQLASPLFTTLPAEIRQIIFTYAVTGYPDPNRPYSRHSTWYRPGYTHARLITTALLLTCRRVYLESDTLPLLHNEHVIWGVERSRVPPWSPSPSYVLNPHGGMRILQRNRIQYVHIFAQQFWLEDWKDKWLAYSQSWSAGCPPKLRITIRHTDWWYNLLGENSPMALDPKRKGRARAGEWIGEEERFEVGSWGQRFEYMSGLKIFELELETVEGKRRELEAIVAKAQTWRIPLGDGRALVLDQLATEWTTWTGSKHFKGYKASNQEPGLQLRQGSTASFVALKKQRTNSTTGSEELAPGDCLDYCVVTLTWRAQASAPPGEATLEKGCVNTENRDELNTNGNFAMATAVTAPLQPSALHYHRLNAIPTAYG